MNRKVCFLSIVLILAIAGAGAAAGAAQAKATATTGVTATAPATATATTGATAAAGATGAAADEAEATAGAAAARAKTATAPTAAAAAVLRQTDPWTPAQLMEPADLVAKLRDIAADPPLIVCVGPSGVIKGSVETGPAREGKNLDSLRRLLASEDRQREIIIYCGCCPFKNCPNVRPAFSLLLYMGFKHPRLLDLSHNIKVDWIDKGYPVTTR